MKPEVIRVNLCPDINCTLFDAVYFQLAYNIKIYFPTKMVNDIEYIKLLLDAVIDFSVMKVICSQGNSEYADICRSYEQHPLESDNTKILQVSSEKYMLLPIEEQYQSLLAHAYDFIYSYYTKKKDSEIDRDYSTPKVKTISKII